MLTELGLIELDLAARSCRIAGRASESDLELSPTYRAASEELEATEHALAAELPRALPAAATGYATGGRSERTGRARCDSSLLT